MSLTLRSPEDVVNAALRRVGYKLRVTNIHDGSAAGDAALDVYAQTRDELLRQNDWGFAERNVNCTLIKQAPASGYFPPVTWNPVLHPPLPWQFAYVYPSDCLKVRALKPVPLFIPNFDPQPNVYATPNDNGQTPPVKIIVSMVPQATLVYTGQVTDPSQWEADFVEAIAAALGRRLAPVLVGLQAAQLAAQDEAVSALVAETQQG